MRIRLTSYTGTIAEQNKLKEGDIFEVLTDYGEFYTFKVGGKVIHMLKKRFEVLSDESPYATV